MQLTKIYGAPGCGKTTRLMDILCTELAQVPSERIAFVSFTRKGTYEGVRRAMDSFSLEEAQLPYFRTLHSIAFTSGEFTKYDMISKSDYKEFSDAMGMRLTGFYTEEFFNSDDKYLFMHFLRRNNLKSYEDRSWDLNYRTLQDVASNFERYKKHNGVYDFTDIIERFIAIGEALPVEVAIIDEAQDLTTLQWKMCEIAFAKCKRIYVAGDDDQAIYEWAGADVEKFLHLSADKTEILNKSYRLPSEILLEAKRVSAMIKNRIEKNFDPVSQGGTVSTYNSVDEVKLTNNESWYFLARNNFFLSKIRTALCRQAVVFKDKSTLSYDPKEIAAIKLYENARKKASLSEQDETRLKLYLRGSIDFSKLWYEVLNFPLDRMAYYRDLIKNKTVLDTADKILVNTIHGVKGGEADHVVVMLDFTKAVKLSFEKNPDSELRCLYVAMTRSAKHLHLVHSQSATGFDKYINLERRSMV